jgi:hypothetical protein
VFIGYTSGTKAYRLLDLATSKVIASCEVIFDKAVGWDWLGEKDDVTSRVLVVLEVES